MWLSWMPVTKNGYELIHEIEKVMTSAYKLCEKTVEVELVPMNVKL